MSRFSAATRGWFARTFGTATEVQNQAWQTIAGGGNALVISPTGSGKTLAAFLWAIDRLMSSTTRTTGTRVLYISPLKALGVDVERNLRAPLHGIREEAGGTVDDVGIGIRSGDTPAAQRRRLITKPPDILITTPESLYLMLTSAARDTLSTVDTVIVDEVHAIAGDKRGAHLAVSLERLDGMLDRPAQRIGLSATVRPQEEVARFLGGAAGASVVAPPVGKRFDLSVTVPVSDMADIPDVPGEERSGSIWPHVEADIADKILANRSTIVFANSRRVAERLTARLNEIYAARSGPSTGAGQERPGEPEPAAAPQVGAAPAEPAPAEPAHAAPAYADTKPPAQLMAQSERSFGADAVLARSHHGSVSKEQRAEIENDLKAGRLRCVVATSSLELGIDMGEVDLVIQVESPPSVSNGLQRVGRSGHNVGDTSRGFIYPTHRTDLIHAAATAERMNSGEIEALNMPVNALDVLAQQTVAAASAGPLDVADWYRTVRRAAPYADLPKSAFYSTLDLLAGKYPSDEFAQLKPRIVFDRKAGTITGRPGSARLAVTSGGTIPDRGLYGVFMVGVKTARVGELDEEMVYESRVGDVFALGATSWRIEEITHDRVTVSPAYGRPGRLPFWNGDNIGRPYELGRALGGFLHALDDGTAGDRLESQGLDDRAANNIRAYVSEQRAATGLIPTDRDLVVERFRDEIGDWRVVLHSPFGRRVHAPWALAVGARLVERYGHDGSAVAGDDGIVLRLPDIDEPPGAELFVFDETELERVVTDQVGSSSLFASRFRECAGRALILPKTHPGRRAPLWQQRRRSADLLAVAAKYPDFPIVHETIRECLSDVYDLPGLLDVAGRIGSGLLRLADVTTPTPSPFARSMLFEYVGQFLYEDDRPLAERKVQVLSIDTSLLTELLGRAQLRDLLDIHVIDETERRLQYLPNEYRVGDMEGSADLLRLLGPLTPDEVAARSMDDAPPARKRLDELARAGRAIRLIIAGTTKWAGIEDAARLRDAVGIRLPAGLPEAYTRRVDDALGDVVGRYARTHGPFRAAAAAESLGLGIETVEATLHRLESDGRVVHGEFRPGGADDEWVDAGVLGVLRRRSLAALRRDVEPVSQAKYAEFMQHWHGVRAPSTDRTGPETDRHYDLLGVIDQLAGLALPASAWETLILPARLSEYSPADLDELMSSGDVVVSGAGRLAGTDGWVALQPADIASLTLPDDEGEQVSVIARRILEVLASGGAFFFRQIAENLADTAENEVVDGLWELFWTGYVGNDTFAPVRAMLSGGTTRRHRARPPRPRMYRGRPVGAMRQGPPVVAGRWSLLPEPAHDPTVRAHAVAEQLLNRYGVVTRGTVTAERVPGAFALVYRVLSEFEDAGRARRGYFVDGLGATQFAEPATVDRLRAASGDTEPVALAATDPANPYGAALPWPDAAHRPGRKAGAIAVLDGGTLAAYLERGGRTMLTFTSERESRARIGTALADAVAAGRIRRLSIETVDGTSAEDAGISGDLQAAGFRSTPKGWRLDR